MSDNFISDLLMDPSRSEGRISSETRAFMTQMLELEPSPEVHEPQEISPHGDSEYHSTVQNLSIPINNTGLPHHLVSMASSLVSLVSQILEELEANLTRLLCLNPSRRDAIAHHLERLAGTPVRPVQTVNTTSFDPSSQLRRWIESPRTTAQNLALKTYFEEVAIITLGQALLLKNWSNLGVRKWNESDLGQLNWALSMALKPFIPLDREGWQITRPNLYSWYNPSPKLQSDIGKILGSWSTADESNHFLSLLIGPVRSAQPEYSEPSGYDPRFYQSLWKHLPHLDWTRETQAGSIKRNRVVFCPTLRDGAIVRTSPSFIQWIGLESSNFQLMIAELMQIWWGPTAPPLWCIGTGIEAHARDQLAFSLVSPKPSVLCRIAEMEACDAAFVLEEQPVRSQGRSISSTQFREQIENLPYFKRLRASGTSLGSLQACVAVSKLRPGGVLLWAREEPLSSKEGTEVLNFLLNRAKLVCEWDFSELEHSLPLAISLYPKHLYLFQREIQIEARLSHRPIRHSIQGQMRSHVEVPIILEDALRAIGRPLESPAPTRGPWTLISHPSPTAQKDWIEKWPDPTSHHQIRQLDQLRAASLPLAHFSTIRSTPEGDPSRNGAWSIHTALKGFWLAADTERENQGERRRLVVRPLPGPGKEAQGHGFLVLVPEEVWVAPLSAYLLSDWVQKWLENHTERRSGRWLLNEQVVKWIPVPKPLLQAMAVPMTPVDSPKLQQNQPIQLPRDWEKWVAEVDHQPREVKKALIDLNASPLLLDYEAILSIHCTIFIQAARSLDYLAAGQHLLFSLVTGDGRIRWKELLSVFPKGECVTISLHPKVRLTGSIPPHLPIGRIDRVKSPSAGILLATESGFTLHIGSDVPLFLNMIWEQLEGISHPTWNELLQFLRIPRKAELAESTAMEVLRSHAEQSTRLKELRDLLSTCQLF